ncbi:hypothetical protein ANN_11376 [Periplaneta americana]|uniref:Uncharacterized protein n=1 Tax=Periplaneta americana TaxID=6978 RepID=A0ABQ8T4U5_PERAM|nr:hypothetical protein ANN_11376 [Periplaneta americana]
MKGSEAKSNQLVCLYHVLLNGAHRYCKLQWRVGPENSAATKARVWCKPDELSVCISTYRATSLHHWIKLFELGETFFETQLAPTVGAAESNNYDQHCRLVESEYT